jgi:hypothetical protein
MADSEVSQTSTSSITCRWLQVAVVILWLCYFASGAFEDAVPFIFWSLACWATVWLLAASASDGVWRVRGRYLLAWACGSLVATCIAATMPVGHRSGASCARCRLGRETGVFWIVPFWRDTPNVFTEWYRLNIDDDHEHVWHRGSCHVTFSALGIPREFACGRRGLACQIPPKYQLEVFEKLDLAEAKSLIEVIATRRATEAAAHLRGLQEWDMGGAHVPWSQWWAANQATFLAENSEDPFRYY